MKRIILGAGIILALAGASNAFEYRSSTSFSESCSMQLQSGGPAQKSCRGNHNGIEYAWTTSYDEDGTPHTCYDIGRGRKTEERFRCQKNDPGSFGEFMKLREELD